MRLIFLLTALTSGLMLSAQQRYVPGYLIDTTGRQRAVLVRTAATRYNPDRVTFRTTPGAAPEELPLTAIRAYGLDDLSERYVRFTVRIDESRQRTSELTSSPEPEWREQTVLLRQLAEGAADLFAYTDVNGASYFVRTGEELPQQLVARRYRGAGREVHHDRRYLAQIQGLDCRMSGTAAHPGLPTTKYTEKDLLEVVAAYNACVGSAMEYYRQPKAKVGFWIGAGMEHGEARYYVLRPRQEVHLGEMTTPRFGGESEFPLSFTRRRYSIYLGAEFRGRTAYAGMLENKYIAAREVTLDYVSFSFPVGIRRYLRLGNRSQLLLTAGGLLDIPIGRGLNYSDGGGKRIKTGTSMGLQLGGGIQLFDRLRIEARYQHNRNISPGYSATIIPYRATAVAVSYRLR